VSAGVAYDVRDATTDDQEFITEMLPEAFFVPPGAEPFSRSILDEPGVRPYHVDVGRVTGGVGVGTALLTALLERVPRCSLRCDTRHPALRRYRRLGVITVRPDGDHSVVMVRDAGTA